MTAFDAQPDLTDGVVRLRPLQAEDQEALRLAASDPQIWAVHPVKDRHTPDGFKQYFAYLLGTGRTLLVEEVATRAAIGCSQYYVGPDAPDDIGIGYTFLTRAHWGGATNWRIKTLMLDHAFRTFDRVWFHVGPGNIRSQKATMKLGVEFVGRARLNLSTFDDDYLCFVLTKEAWQAQP